MKLKNFIFNFFVLILLIKKKNLNTLKKGNEIYFILILDFLYI